MSLTLGIYFLALIFQLLFILRLLRAPGQNPVLILPVLALLGAVVLMVLAFQDNNLVLLLGQGGLAVLYTLHLMRRNNDDDA